MQVARGAPFQISLFLLRVQGTGEGVSASGEPEREEDAVEQQKDGNGQHKSGSFQD
jgi:hypothetical protein